MEHIHASQLNRFEAPQGDAMARSSAHAYSSPGVPKENYSLNGSLEKIGENSGEGKVLTGQLVRVGDYKPEYCKIMYDWFCSKDQTYTTHDTMVWKNGEVSEKARQVPNPPPHFSEFARTIGTTWKTLKNWAKKHTEFADAYEACQDIIQEFMVNNGVTGAYSGQFGIFAAKNLTKMRDVTINKNENYNMREILDAIEKGINPNESNDF